jgi:prophage DNA circulation protein
VPSLEERLPSLRRAIIELVDAFIESLEDASVRTVVREQIHLLDRYEQLDGVIEIVNDIASHVRENNDALAKQSKQIATLQQQVAGLKRQVKKNTNPS